MSRKPMTRLLCLLFAAAMLFSVPGAFSGRGFLFAEESAAGTGAAKSSEPSYIFDFTDYDTYSIRGGGNCSTEITDDGLLCYCDGDDPNVYIGMPDIEGTKMGWLVIRYRGETNYDARYAELYYIAEGDEYSERDRLRWKWDGVSDEWNTQVIQGRALGKKKEPVIDMRFDPLSSGAGASALVEAGEQLEVAFIAFFPTEEEARAFDYDAYIAAQAAATPTKAPVSDENWKQPAFKAPDVTLKADNVPGTLNIGSVPASAESGAKWRISYSTGGRDFAFEVPQNGFMLNGPLSGTDDVGRSIPDGFDKVKPDYIDHVDKKSMLVEVPERAVGVYGENGEHYVGIFYFLWHGTMADANAPIRNVQSILEKYGDSAKDTGSVWGNVYDTFWFAEPLYGYYRSEDEWVIRKHMELLINAGVDFLYFDTTNNFLYGSTALKVMEVCHDLNEQGLPAPKVVFYTNTDAKIRVRQALREVYEPNRFPDTWMMLDGKPLIIAPEAANVNDYFTIREPQWPNEEKRENTWPWIDWEWPQTLHGKDLSEAISVSVAQHSGNCEFSSTLYGYRGNRGRSYDGYEDAPTADSYKNGANVQLQFNRAVASGVPYVLVTGWNEWIANRQKPTTSKRPICFIDTFNYEYSRDMEMSRGGYFDNYYMQLAENIAVLRGAAPVILRDDRHQINVTGDFGQWDAVIHYYTDPSGDAAARRSFGCGGNRYENNTGRNDIVRVKVTNDASYLYFMAECASDIVRGSAGDSWMQFYLDVDGSAESGWYGYDYIAGFNAKNDYTTTLARYSGSGGAYGFTDTAELTFKVDGNRLMLAVPMELLGIEHYNRIDLKFKVADSRSQITTMEQFYEDGDAAPLGRPNFTYQTYIEGVTDGTPVKVVKVADRVDYAKNEPDITPEPARSGNNGKGVNIKLIVLVAVLAVSAGIAVWRILKTVRRNKAQQGGTQTEGQTPEQKNGDNK
ncbi:MAG: hypothetical protein II789_06615 [Clostridia bacterium]|nr:hypothetical protein [Clostridia bacterium]